MPLDDLRREFQNNWQFSSLQNTGYWPRSGEDIGGILDTQTSEYSAVGAKEMPQNETPVVLRASREELAWSSAEFMLRLLGLSACLASFALGGEVEQSSQQTCVSEGTSSNLGRVICMVPARLGSTRLHLKNLRIIHGRFLCEYALRAAALSGVCDRVVLNADFDGVAPLASLVNDELSGTKATAVEFYRRPSTLQGHLPADNVVADFMRSHQGDTLIWVNPTSPLQTASDVRTAASFLAARPNSNVVIGAERILRHAAWMDTGAPLNFEVDTPGARTQELRQLAIANYCVLMWRYASFMQAYERTGAGYFAGPVAWLPANRYQNVVVKTQADLDFARMIMTGYVGAALHDLDTDDDENRRLAYASDDEIRDDGGSVAAPSETGKSRRKLARKRISVASFEERKMRLKGGALPSLDDEAISSR